MSPQETWHGWAPDATGAGLAGLAVPAGEVAADAAVCGAVVWEADGSVVAVDAVVVGEELGVGWVAHPANSKAAPRASAVTAFLMIA
ncbi:hypothetical protein [Arthrobacter antibioticus]|uniref:hypothetical protein n=1 Tax=Arthrobacter sp. H35-MC1 TaxID=3046203 RepID=UPI0024BB2D1A|nr:hypothetical protein [Arthrobacter sp. H35-MC1]MDJ0318882.1 hypothetical protein [Arthrobacter sp. H35-MC1]